MSLPERIDALDWATLHAELWQHGAAMTTPVLSAEECHALRAMYTDTDRFRSRVDMARHNYGVGEYQYLRYPLPELVQNLRETLYHRLAPLATEWERALGNQRIYPDSLSAFIDECRAVGQTRPTPLLLEYREGGYNCLHQDLYGDVWFPLQVTGFLSAAGEDFEGGEFLLVEQRPRAQSIGRAFQPPQGALIIIATRYRPVRGSRGYYRATLRHGVSPVRRGHRGTLGIIFHDAQ